MEELNDNPHPDYSKGFNNGYLIAQHNPQLSKELTKSLSDTEQSKGFEAGIRQAFLDKTRGYPLAWMQHDFKDTILDKFKDDKENDLDKE